MFCKQRGGLSFCDGKAKNVFIPTVWPYNFFGPCTKSKAKNNDWKCMKCFVSGNSDKITYYKSRRTDATIEICARCALVYSQKKVSKKMKKRLTRPTRERVRYGPPPSMYSMPPSRIYGSPMRLSMYDVPPPMPTTYRTLEPMQYFQKIGIQNVYNVPGYGPYLNVYPPMPIQGW